MKLLSLLALLGSTAWLASSPSWEPAVTFVLTLAGYWAIDTGLRLPKWKRTSASRPKTGLLVIDALYFNTILLGPRGAGKTSMALSWTSPWSPISHIAATPLVTVYDREISELGTEKEPIHSQHRSAPAKWFLRTLIHDYPGELQFQRHAIESLRDYQYPSLIVLVVPVDASGELSTRTQGYFCHDFFNTLRAHSEFYRRFAGVRIFVAFNKIDLLQDRGAGGVAVDALRKRYRKICTDIESIFPNAVEYAATSVLTNEGMTDLLGAISLCGLSAVREVNRSVTLTSEVGPFL